MSTWLCAIAWFFQLCPCTCTLHVPEFSKWILLENRRHSSISNGRSLRRNGDLCIFILRRSIGQPTIGASSMDENTYQWALCSSNELNWSLIRCWEHTLVSLIADAAAGTFFLSLCAIFVSIVPNMWKLPAHCVSTFHSHTNSHTENNSQSNEEKHWNGSRSAQVRSLYIFRCIAFARNLTNFVFHTRFHDVAFWNKTEITRTHTHTGGIKREVPAASLIEWMQTWDALYSAVLCVCVGLSSIFSQ